MRLVTGIVLSVLFWGSDPSVAEEITITLPSEECEVPLDFGVSVASVDTVKVSGAYTKTRWQWCCWDHSLFDCIESGPCGFTPSGFLELCLVLEDDGGRYYLEIDGAGWHESGVVDVMWPRDGRLDLSFVDGTGTIGIFYDPTQRIFSEQSCCDLDSPGDIELIEPLVVTIKYTVAVPAEDDAWGDIKCLYR